MDEINELIKWWSQNYGVAALYDTAGEKITVGVAGKCRFCGKDNSETTFRNKAHAISDSLGNRKIISLDECDECNGLFGRTIEDHLGRYMAAPRAISQIIGKRGVPSYKTKQKKSRLSTTEGCLSIENHEDDSFVEIDENNKTVTYTMTRQSYSPISVYKAFVKMAISIAPQSLLPYLNEANRWVRSQNSNHISFPPFIFEGFIPGLTPFQNNIWTTLLVRKTNTPSPGVVFVLQVSNYLFQIPIPSPIIDADLGVESISMQMFPTPFDLSNPCGAVKRWPKKMEGHDLIQNDEFKITQKCIEMTPVDISNKKIQKNAEDK